MSFWDRLKFKKKPFKEPKEPAKERLKKETTPSAETLAAAAIIPSSLSELILRPLLSEKSSLLSEQGKYVFEIDPRANKNQVADAIGALYGEWPLEVNVVKIKGKQVRYGRLSGRTRNRKKAIITMPAGKKLDVYK